MIFGGYLGMMFPDVRLTFTIGRFLPDALTSNDYINDLVFPPLADIQTPWGAEEPFKRPSAPFAYTNGWGAAMAVLTPIAVGTAIGHRTARAMWFLLAGLLAAIPPRSPRAIEDSSSVLPEASSMSCSGSSSAGDGWRSGG
ncbi:hypothetical protein [Microbacterium sp. NIBRBAC000506063]|uniref:hypothetical protein n=1 Tax=Microbacterium sp. NIBRBAC000506063 TaxID=2734618 RepID=UPI001BB4A987|nr:hypothetical protein [Microbacterium sp. NIBRBAC000506063]QTV80191.1 hypothetical protein KAE78_03890 [Microbacterium sp. NIBRBAC000506063]